MALPLFLRRLGSLSRRSFGVRNYSSWTKILADSLNQFHENDLFTSAAAMSYFGLMALFPTLLLVLAVSHRLVDGGEILGPITQWYPGSGEFLRTTAESLSNVGTGAIVSCIGIVLWAGTWVFSIIERALNRIWDTTSRTFLQGRALSLGMMGLVGCLLSCSVLMTSLLVTLHNVTTRMPSPIFHRMKFFPLIGSVFWQFSFGLASILVTIALFTLVYRFLPNARVTPHDVRPGALVAGFFWELAKYLFAWTLQYLHYDQIYGPVGALLDQYHELEIAAILNKRGYRSGEGHLFSSYIVGRVRSRYGLKNRFNRLREAGLLTLQEMANLLGVSIGTVKTWKNHGLLAAQAYNDRDQCLYEHPGDNPPRKIQGLKGKLSNRSRLSTLVSDHANEVQYEA